MRAGEWALLVLPCVALASFAWWQSQKKNKYPTSSDPIAPVILKAELEPATPLDVYNGWDTRFVLEAQVPSHMAAKPGDYATSAQADLHDRTLHYQHAGREVVLPMPNGKRFQGSIRNSVTTTTTLLMKLRELPITSSPVTFRGGVIASYVKSATVNGVPRNVVTKSKPIPFSVVVRRANQRVVLPVVSRYRPFSLDKVAVKREKIHSGKAVLSDTTVEMIFSVANSDFVPTLNNIRLVDGRGKEHQTFLSPTTKIPVSPMWRSHSAKDSPDGKYHQWLSFPVSFLPKSTGRITFKTDVSVNSCWPLPISVVVREK